MHPVAVAAIIAAAAVVVLAAVALALRYNYTRPSCGCTHHLAAHDPQDGLRCTAQVLQHGTGSAQSGFVNCACKHYVGPRPPRNWIGNSWIGDSERGELHA